MNIFCRKTFVFNGTGPLNFVLMIQFCSNKIWVIRGVKYEWNSFGVVEVWIDGDNYAMNNYRAKFSDSVKAGIQS